MGAAQRRKFLYANLLILKASCYAALRSQSRRVRMVKPVFRRKSIGTKVSEEEYAQLETKTNGSS
jgi:hypothetical protein